MDDNSVKPFGKRALELSVANFLWLERDCGINREFQELEELIVKCTLAPLQGERLIAIENTPLGDSIELKNLDNQDLAYLESNFSLNNQQSKGAWYVSDQLKLPIGLLNFPYYLRKYPRYSNTISQEERAYVSAADSSQAIFIWSVLVPLFEELLLPFELRGRLTGSMDREEQKAAWAGIDTFLETIGIQASDELVMMRFGGSWSKLRSKDQISLKIKLLESLAAQISPYTIARYRASAIQALITRYFGKAKKSSPTMKQVLTKPLQRSLSAFFGGDWLSFLKYIGEEPSPQERIVTALAETRLFVEANARAAEVAKDHGLPVGEVERMLSTFWDSPKTSSPVQERVSVLQDYWQEFKSIHERQTSGMNSLWGLIEEDFTFRLDADDENNQEKIFLRSLYRRLFSAKLIHQIEALWGTKFLGQWPDSIVTEISPHAAFLETFGPALTFWHGVALTAWFICEGPYSRTDLKGLSKYYEKELAQLEASGFSIPPNLLVELIEAENRLGEPMPIERPHPVGEDTSGITIMFSTVVGYRRTGFGILKEIIIKYLNRWGEQYFESYLRHRWESEICEAARDYNKLYEKKGKNPTLKQFAHFAEHATNHWFGGDIGSLYAAFGEKVPVESKRQLFVPADKESFVWKIFFALGGRLTKWSELQKRNDDRKKLNDEWRAYLERKRLAELSITYLQLREAIGRPPELKNFGRAKFEATATTLCNDIDEAWRMYQQTIEVML